MHDLAVKISFAVCTKPIRCHAKKKNKKNLEILIGYRFESRLGSDQTVPIASLPGTQSSGLEVKAPNYFRVQYR